ncbi:MAG: glycosyltransferase, partial [Gemmataceae bacterium]
RVQFLGFRTDVPRILAATDLLVHPARYEAYGLGVHEALCRGVPAMVSASAGVAERFPAALQQLLIPDPNDAPALAERLAQWFGNAAAFEEPLGHFADALRSRCWDECAAEIVALVG